MNLNVVCFDHHILVWGIKEQATAGQEEMVPRAKAFLKSLTETQTHVLIPSIVIAEFLMPIPLELHATVVNLFDRSFMVVPFDSAAASAFARIWQAKKGQAIVEDLVANGKTRAELRADSMIVATAYARNASCIYSHDNGVKAFAKDFILVKDIPVVPQQQAFTI